MTILAMKSKAALGCILATAFLTLGATACRPKASESWRYGVRQETASCAPLAPGKVKAIAAFASCYGLVRYFQPSSEARSLGDDAWWALAIEGARRVESAKDSNGAVAAIRGILDPVAPTMRAWKGDSRPHLEDLDRRIATCVVVARQVVAGKPAARYEADPVVVPLDQPLPTVARRPENPLVEDLPGEWHIEVHTSLYAKKHGILGRVTTLPEALSPVCVPVPPAAPGDRWSRIGVVIVAWNQLNSFEPEAWPGSDSSKKELALERAIHDAAESDGNLQLLNVLRELTAAFADGHAVAGRTGPGSGIQYGLPDAGFVWAGDDLFVSRVGPDSPLKTGDQITSVDGEPIASAYSRTQGAVSGTPWFVRVAAVNPVYGRSYLFRGPVKDSIRMGVVRGSEELEVQVPRVGVLTADLILPPEKTRTNWFETLPGGLVYIDLTSPNATVANVLGVRDAMGHARGVVFDLRGAPQPQACGVIGQFTNEDWHFIQIRYPEIWMPGVITYKTGEGIGDFKTRGPFAGKRLAFLVDAGDVSYGETIAQAVRDNHLGLLVGEQTAGACGNLFRFNLPDGYWVSRTGLSAEGIHGEKINGVGIAPDVLIHTTPVGLRSGRDETLDRAVKLLQ